MDLSAKSRHFKISWRTVWYSVLIWLIAYISASVILVPWFYLVLPLFVLATTSYYFRKRKRNFTSALALSMYWFFILFSLDVLEIIGPYYANAAYYFSDMRNWFIYPLILLIPVIYGLKEENKRIHKSLTRKTTRIGKISTA